MLSNDYQTRETLTEALDEEQILSLARQIIQNRFQSRQPITSAREAKQYLTLALADDTREHFGVLFLNNAHAVMGFEILFSGTLNGATVYCREVVVSALKYKAAAVIVAHNHPSGVREPSRQDIQITSRLAAALDTVDIKLLDHVIVAGTETISLAERGELPNR